MKINIDTRALRAASIFVSDEETRYYLKGVYIEPSPAGGVIAVAMDGHRLAAIHDPYGVAERPAILAMEWSSKALKEAKREMTPRRLDLDLGEKPIPKAIAANVMGNCSEVKGSDKLDPGEQVDVISVSEIDGTFPAWRFIVPYHGLKESFAAGHFGINTAYVDDCRKAALAYLPKDQLKGMVFRRKEVGDPVIITATALPNVLFLVMPLRKDGDDKPHDFAWIGPKG